MALSFDDMISATIDNANNIQHACRMLLPIRTVINYVIHTLQPAACGKRLSSSLQLAAKSRSERF